MTAVSINGRPYSFQEPVTILRALESVGIEVPALCDDPRLKPCGSCRMCLVEVEGSSRPVASCHTEIADGMRIQTHTAALEAGRRAVLGLLAARYPGEAVTRRPDKPFHRWLRHYGMVEAALGLEDRPEVDESHPYIRVDMAQCIYCYRCVRICAEVQGQFIWGARNRSSLTSIQAGPGVPFGESECVSCGACSDTCPTGTIEDKQALERPAARDWIRTTCPYCGTGCEMYAGTAEGKLVQVKPVLDAPVSKGHLCVKGRYAFDFVHARDRVSSPMLRRNGSWAAVGWDEAAGFAASELSRIARERGPDAIGILGSSRATNEENYVTQKFARIVAGTNNVDCCARVCHAPTAAAMSLMLGTGAATNSFDDIEKAGLVFVYGSNATENHPIVGARIKQAALNGARLIVADPRRTELARYATIHLPVRPGTDVLLLNAMACVIAGEGLFDSAFVADRISGWEEYQRFIRDWTPRRASSDCGVPEEKIRQAARLYASVKPAMSVHGLGVTEHSQGTEGVMCLVNLALLTGNFGKPGAGVNPLRGQNNVQGAAHMGCEPDHLTGFQKLEAGRELFERVWDARLPLRRGKNLMGMLDAAGRGELAALWTIGYDVFLTNPDTAGMRRAFENLDLVIVQDLFLNETARAYGTVFFPAASSFEKDGTFMNAERRVQRVRKVIEPLGESRSDWEIICEVARRMGRARGFEFRSAGEIWDEVRSVWQAGAGMSYARLEAGGLQWPCPAGDHPGTQILHTAAFPLGQRAALRSLAWEPTPERPSAEFPLLLTTGRSLYQFNAATMTRRSRNAHWRPSDTLDISPDEAARAGVRNGDQVRLVSRYGSAQLPVRVTAEVLAGQAFATFHSSEIFLNEVTGPYRDRYTQTPEYKVTAVRVEKLARDKP